MEHEFHNMELFPTYRVPSDFEGLGTAIEKGSHGIEHPVN